MANLDSWSGFIGTNFLKADMVRDENHPFVCVRVELYADEDNSNNVRLHLESLPLQVIFDLNVTNSKKVAELGIPSPNALVGKKIYFRKVLVRNPKTNQEVDGLRVYKVE